VSIDLQCVLRLYIYFAKILGTDTRFETYCLTFMWVNTEAAANLPKHGILFEHATEAVLDPFLKLVDASRHEEVRDAIIGMDTRWNLLFVVHIEL
jgi:uncharacterized DUF497 family protein